MDFSERNRKVAIARWDRIHQLEILKFNNDNSALKLKAALSGFLAGDGNVQFRINGNHYEIRFFPDDIEMVNMYCKAMNDVYSKKPHIKRKEHFYKVEIKSKAIFQDLIKYASFGLYLWQPPSFFRVEEKISWLRAFFSSESYVGSGVIKLQTVNESGMKKVSLMLQDLGIISHFYEYQPKKRNHSKVFIIVISGQNNLKKFDSLIGFWHKGKTATLKKSLSF